MHLGIGATSPTVSRRDICESRGLVVHCPSLQSPAGMITLRGESFRRSTYAVKVNGKETLYRVFAKGGSERQCEKVSAFGERSIGREPRIRLVLDSLTRVRLSFLFLFEHEIQRVRKYGLLGVKRNSDGREAVLANVAVAARTRVELKIIGEARANREKLSSEGRKRERIRVS